MTELRQLRPPIVACAPDMDDHDAWMILMDDVVNRDPFVMDLPSLRHHVHQQVRLVEFFDEDLFTAPVHRDLLATSVALDRAILGLLKENLRDADHIRRLMGLPEQKAQSDGQPS